MYHLISYICLCFFLTVSGEDPSDNIHHLPKDCGKTRFNANSTFRIVGGSKARLGQFPWMARLGIKRKMKKLAFHCGGSLIHRYYVLSAAHCGEKTNIVRLGESNTVTSRDCDNSGVCATPVQDIAVKAHRFENYCRNINDNDLMVLELEDPAIMNDFVQPICLPSSSVTPSDLVGKSMLLSGWGAEDGFKPPEESKDLNYLHVPVVDFETCKEQFTNAIEGRQLCVKSVEGHNICNGDSGGSAARPMTVKGVSRMYIFGVASYVQANCVGGAVFMHVPYYVDFIVAGINKI